jgi:hypothetical protein
VGKGEHACGGARSGGREWHGRTQAAAPGQGEGCILDPPTAARGDEIGKEKGRAFPCAAFPAI